MVTFFERPYSFQKTGVMSLHMHGIIYPSLKRLAQIRFGEPKNSLRDTADRQVDDMIIHLVGITYIPSRLYMRYIIANMILEYCITGAVDISFNRLNELDKLYWDGSPNQLLSVRPDRLLEYKPERKYHIVPHGHYDVSVDDVGPTTMVCW